MISKTTGIITTIVDVAGNLGYMAGNVADPGVVVSAAQGLTDHPYGLAFDNNGNLYIADNYNNLVDAVNLGTTTATIAGVSIPAGAIYTIAGAGCPYNVGSTGCGSAYGTTNGVGTASKLDSPYQVAVDNSGNVYIADEFPYDVRVLTPAGQLSVFANQLVGGKATKSASITRGPALTTPLASIYGVATDRAGNVYIAVYEATSSSSYIDRVDIATGIVYPVAGQQVTAAPVQGQSQIPGTGAKYCAGESDAVGDGCPGLQATFYKPFQPFVDAAGNVYIADQANQLVRKVTTGAQFPAAGQAVGAAATQTLEVHFGGGRFAGQLHGGGGFRGLYAGRGNVYEQLGYDAGLPGAGDVQADAAGCAHRAAGGEKRRRAHEHVRTERHGRGGGACGRPGHAVDAGCDGRDGGGGGGGRPGGEQLRGGSGRELDREAERGGRGFECRGGADGCDCGGRGYDGERVCGAGIRFGGGGAGERRGAGDGGERDRQAFGAGG